MITAQGARTLVASNVEVMNKFLEKVDAQIRQDASNGKVSTVVEFDMSVSPHVGLRTGPCLFVCKAADKIRTHGFDVSIQSRSYDPRGGGDPLQAHYLTVTW
jgi:hypothetical protein